MKHLLFTLGLLFSAASYALPALDVTQVAPGIYLHQAKHHWPDKENHGEIANIGFIVGNKCVAVIDSGGSPQQGLALRTAIKQTTNIPVCYVINSHVHPDHIYGNSAFKSTSVQFIGHYKLARAMAERGGHYVSRASETLGIHINEDNIIPPSLQVNNSMTINLGDRELVLTAHGSAHTDNDLSIFDKTTNTAWLADLVFLDHIPVLDGSIKGWLTELAKLEQQPYQLVIPGHGNLIRQWPAGMQAEKQYLQHLLTQIRIMIKQGKTLEQATEQIGLEANGHWQLVTEFHRKNISTAFAELEWEE